MPRGRRRFPIVTSTIFGLFALAAVILRGACSRSDPFTGDWSSPPLTIGDYELVDVTAPDDVKMRRDGRTVRIRLMGVAPDERSSIRGDAVVWLRSRLEGGVCRLEFDKRRIDRDGAYLAYLYTGDLFLNEELVRAGLARARTMPDDSQSLARRITRAEDEAKSAERGLWSKAAQSHRH